MTDAMFNLMKLIQLLLQASRIKTHQVFLQHLCRLAAALDTYHKILKIVTIAFRRHRMFSFI